MRFVILVAVFVCIASLAAAELELNNIPPVPTSPPQMSGNSNNTNTTNSTLPPPENPPNTTITTNTDEEKKDVKTPNVPKQQEQPKTPSQTESGSGSSSNAKETQNTSSQTTTQKQQTQILSQGDGETIEKVNLQGDQEPRTEDASGVLSTVDYFFYGGLGLLIIVGAVVGFMFYRSKHQPFGTAQPTTTISSPLRAPLPNASPVGTQPPNTTSQPTLTPLESPFTQSQLRKESEAPQKISANSVHTDHMSQSDVSTKNAALPPLDSMPQVQLQPQPEMQSAASSQPTLDSARITQLRTYITHMRTSGYADDVITQQCLSSGWAQEYIDAAK